MKYTLSKTIQLYQRQLKKDHRGGHYEVLFHLGWTWGHMALRSKTREFRYTMENAYEVVVPYDERVLVCHMVSWEDHYYVLVSSPQSIEGAVGNEDARPMMKFFVELCRKYEIPQKLPVISDPFKDDKK